MNKTIGIVSAIVVAVIIFGVGYFTGNLNKNEVSREIKIGYQNSDNPDQIVYNHTFTDKENQTIIDNVLMIYLHKEKTKNVDLAIENLDINPDIYIGITSPKLYASLIDSKVWFTNEDAIIGIRHGESWEEVEYHKIGKSEADYIKEISDYQEE